MLTKVRPWEGLAVDLVYRDKDPVTIAVLSRHMPDLEQWLSRNVERPKLGELCFVYTYEVTVH